MQIGSWDAFLQQEILAAEAELYFAMEDYDNTEKALEQAELYGHSLEREIAYLTVHSMLHLLGYDHVDGGIQKMKMREKEETVLDLLGLSIIKD